MGDTVALVTVVGVPGERFDLLAADARRALADAEVLCGGRRLLAAWDAWREAEGAGPVPGAVGAVGAVGTVGAVESIEIGADADAVARAVRRAACDAGRRVCVLASGDPGFFGIVRPLLRVLDRRSLRVLPAVSSVAVAFARLGLPWDDAAVVSAHARPLADAVGTLLSVRKAAVLTSPGSPPEALGAALVDAGVAMDLVAVCSRLGSDDETVVELTLDALAEGTFDPLSVVVLVGPGGLPLAGSDAAPAADKVLAWGLPEERFAHRANMITKAEVRAVVISKLALPPRGVLWDVGAGSGSVAVECAGLRPGLRVVAVEESTQTAARIAENAAAHGVGVQVVPGRAPGALDALPSPDRAFVGGGGIEVLDAVLARLAPGGRMVAAFAAMDRAVAAVERLGNLVQVAVGRGARLPDGGWRLESQHPVFVVWGPE